MARYWSKRPEISDYGSAPYCRGFSVKDWGSAVLGIIGIIFGELILANTLVTALMLPYIIGAFAIVGSFMLRKYEEFLFL